jgi:hypothetical protein
MSITSDMSITSAQIRIANLSPSKPPIDVCLALHGSGQFNGPILKPVGVVDTGLAYPQVSKYLAVGAGQYDVRIVDGGATSCAQSLYDATSLPALAVGRSYTIVGTGFIPPQSGNPSAFTVVVYGDDGATDASSISLRFIHDAPNTPPLDLVLGSGSTATGLFANVSYLSVGTAPQADGKGYVSQSAQLLPATLSLRVHGSSSDALVITRPSALPGGSVATLFAIGELGGTPKPLQALVCLDSSIVSPSALATCAVLP